MGKTTYYFNAKGYRQTGWKTISKKKYYFNAKGVYLKGWKKIDGKKYYFSSKGVMATGWKKISGKKYYFSKKGVLQTGWKTIDGKKYYFTAKGVMITGWKTISGKTYYFSKNGVLQKSKWVDGRWLDKNGVWVKTKTHPHKYSSKVTKEATCTTDGTKTYTCSCGDTYTETIKATGHSFGDTYDVLIDVVDPVYDMETHFISRHGVDLTEVYGVHSGKEARAKCDELGEGSYSTTGVSILVQKGCATYTRYRKCSTCGTVETVKTWEEYYE